MQVEIRPNPQAGLFFARCRPSFASLFGLFAMFQLLMCSFFSQAIVVFKTIFTIMTINNKNPHR
jgi:hypothetical protein